jgi:hypothetical protein
MHYPPSDDEYGDGFFDDFQEYTKRFYYAFKGPREFAPPDVRYFLQDFGDFTITSISACRSPIPSVIETAANVISLGKWDKRKADLNYDKMFHLYLLMSIQKGYRTINFILEKNDVVKITHNPSLVDTDCIYIPIPVNRKITFNQFITNAEKVHPNTFWLYNAKYNNCQDFLLLLLQTSNLGTKEDYSFIKQNVDDLVVYPLERLASFGTNLRARIDILLHGLGLN